MKKIHENNYPYPSINWYPGLLNKYESFESFVAKFCRLNDLTVKQFSKYWKNKVSNCDFENESDRLCHIMTLLNEPYQVVSTVFSAQINKIDIISRHLPIAKYNVRYCKECIKLSYHSYFHNKIWLKNCPIHSNILIEEKNPKNHINPNKTSFELRIIALNKLYDNNYLEKMTSSLNFTDFEELESWLFELENEYQKYTLIQLDFIPNSYEGIDTEALTTFFNFAYPKEKNLNKVYEFKKKIFEQPYKLSTSASRELEKILSIIPLYFLVIFYQTHCGFNIENFKKQYIEFIEEERNKIANSHTENFCLWSKKGLIGNWEYCETNRHNNIYEVCIFEYISEKINNDWLDFRSNRTKDVYKIYTIYNECSRKLRKNLLAKNRVDGGFPNLLDLNFSKELIDFLDLILLELAKNYISDLNQWLDFHVKKHTVKLPRSFDRSYQINFASRVYLKFDRESYILVNSNSHVVCST